jgi:pyruvate,orthophosphate dikinase
MGSEAYTLARMAAIGLPVPHAVVLGPGFSHPDEAREPEAQGELNQTLATQLRRLESATHLTYGGSRRPLLLSVRAAAPQSAPGLREGIVNVGLNEISVRGLLRMTGNPRLTWDAYRRLIQSFAEVVDGCPSLPFDEPLNEMLERSTVARAQELDGRSLAKLTREYLAIYKKLVGKNFPQDTMEQLKAAVHGVFRSSGADEAHEYRRVRKTAEDAGTAVIVQRMVFGNAGGSSGAGAAFTRDPGSGANRLCVDFMFNAQAEDVASGRHNVIDADQLQGILPTIARQVVEAARLLETEFKNVQEFEFTVQDEVVFLLRTRAGRRTALADLRIAIDQVSERLIEPAEALTRLASFDSATLRNEHVRATGETNILCEATVASPGVAIGAIALDVAKAKAMGTQQPVVLVRRDADVADIAGIVVAEGMLTARGGCTSHAAVAARELGKVALIGCNALSIDMSARVCTIGNMKLHEGDIICLDGLTGCVSVGRPAVSVEIPESELAALERWRKLAGRSQKVRVRAT